MEMVKRGDEAVERQMRDRIRTIARQQRIFGRTTRPSGR
jgi:hypothetical protein